MPGIVLDMPWTYRQQKIKPSLYPMCKLIKPNLKGKKKNKPQTLKIKNPKN